MNLSEKYLSLKTEMLLTEKELKRPLLEHVNKLVKIGGIFHMTSSYVSVDDKTGKPFVRTNHYNDNGSITLNNKYMKELTQEDMENLRIYETHEYQEILEFVQNKIYRLKKNEEITVKEQKERLKFWENLERKILKACPHKFNGRWNYNDYCEICGLEKEE